MGKTSTNTQLFERKYCRQLGIHYYYENIDKEHGTIDVRARNQFFLV